MTRKFWLALGLAMAALVVASPALAHAGHQHASEHVRPSHLHGGADRIANLSVAASAPLSAVARNLPACPDGGCCCQDDRACGTPQPRVLALNPALSWPAPVALSCILAPALDDAPTISSTPRTQRARAPPVLLS